MQALYTGGLIDFESAMPAALHSLGCSAEEIAVALERKRKVEEEAAAMKQIEDKTNKAELERREKDAKNPPKPEGGAGSGGSGGAGKSAAPAPAKPKPKKPESVGSSDGGGADDD